MPGTLLTDDLFLEILSRLPICPLFRFKCVSKQWHNLASEAYSRRPPLGVFGREKAWIHGFTLTSPNDHTLEDVTPNQCKHIVDSCNGLILFQRENSYYVYNPLTKNTSTLIPSQKYDDPFYNMLVFDHRISHHFKLLRILYLEQRIEFFSSATGRYMSSPTEQMGCYTLPYHRHPTVCLHGTAYRLRWGGGLLKFGMESNKFEHVALPMNKASKFHELHLGECGGCLICVDIDSLDLRIWALMDCASNVWELKHQVGLDCVWGLWPHDLDEGLGLRQKNLDQTKPFLFVMGNRCCFGVHPHKQVVFIRPRSSKRVLSYDYGRAGLEELCTLPEGDGDDHACVFAASLHNPPPVKTVRKWWWFW